MIEYEPTKHCIFQKGEATQSKICKGEWSAKLMKVTEIKQQREIPEEWKIQKKRQS